MPSGNPQIRALQQAVTTVDGSITLTASASTTNGTDQQNLQWTGLLVGINITAITAGSLTVTVQGKDPMGGNYYTLLASAALGTTGFTTLSICPGLPATANVSANAILPMTYRIIAVVATGPCTATISQTLIP